MTRVGIHIEPQYGFTYDEIVAIAQRAEQTGYHALWTSDHLIWDAESTQRHCFGNLDIDLGLGSDDANLALGVLGDVLRSPLSQHTRQDRRLH